MAGPLVHREPRASRRGGGLGGQGCPPPGTQVTAPRQTHLPCAGPTRPAYKRLRSCGGPWGLSPWFEGKLRRQDASQLLAGGNEVTLRRLSTGPALGGAPSSRRCVGSMLTRPPPPPPPAPASRAVPPAPGARPLHGPGHGALGSSPCGTVGLQESGGRRLTLTLSPTPQPSGPHLPQAEPPQLLQAGFQPPPPGPAAVSTAWVSSFPGTPGCPGLLGTGPCAQGGWVLAASLPAPARR